jgi:hypothetical protein
VHLWQKCLLSEAEFSGRGAAEMHFLALIHK